MDHSINRTMHLTRKKPKYDVTQTKPLFTRLQNAVNKNGISTLVNHAKNRSMDKNVEHGNPESKCFCFNACVKWDQHLEPEIIPSSIQNLLATSDWNSLSDSIKSSCLNLIKLVGEQVKILGKNLENNTCWIAFELIRLPLQKGTVVPTLQWHRDPGYFNDLSEETSFYADYTTIFMLSNPNSWNGGFLEIQKNGIEKGDRKGTGLTEQIRYLFNEAVTFYNKDSRHRVTRIESHNEAEDRIIFTCSIYGDKETEAYFELSKNPYLKKIYA